MNFRPVALILILFLYILSSCNDDEVSIITSLENTDNPLLEVDFVLTYGGSNLDEAIDIIEANDGGYMVLGSTRSTDGDVTDKTTNDQDYWLLKLDASGQKLWDKTYGGSDDDTAKSISKTTDGGFILAGQSKSNDGDVGGNEGFFDFWIVKVDALGAIEWEKNYGYEGGDQAFDVFQTMDGGYFVTGIIDVTASAGEGNIGNPRNANNHAGGDYWVMKLSASGGLIWSRYFGGTFTDTAYEAVETANGDFILSGESDSTDVDITGNKGEYDFWIVKISSMGELIWNKNFGGEQIEIPYALTKSLDGNYITAGNTRSNDQDVSFNNGNADLWVVKFNEDGGIIWERNFGGDQFDSAKSVYAMQNGSYVISGDSRSATMDVDSNKGQNDTWTIIISDSGVLEAGKAIGGSNFDFGERAIQTSDNKIISVGSTESSDGDVTTNKGLKDIIITKFN